MLWSLPITNSVKMVLWHACYDDLPTRVIIDSLFPLYLLEEETVGHILWHLSVNDIWLICSRKIQKSSMSDTNFGCIAT